MSYKLSLVPLISIALLGLSSAPLADGAVWESLHREMREPLAEIFTGSSDTAEPEFPVENQAEVSAPWVIAVGFTGGIEGKESKSSGVAILHRKLVSHAADRQILPMAFNNFRWRRAAQQVTEVIHNARHEDGLMSLRQPLVMVYGHSWGGGSVTKFARELDKKGLEVTLAVYIDAVGWRNPRVPANVRYAVNFYQRSGILSGLPLRGRSKLIMCDREATVYLGSYCIDPETEHWGWSWNPLQPLLYRHHHRISHDLRLQQFFFEALNLKLNLIGQLLDPAGSATTSRSLSSGSALASTDSSARSN